MPAPLGPITEVINPGLTIMVTWERAFKPPKERVTFEILRSLMDYFI